MLLARSTSLAQNEYTWDDFLQEILYADREEDLDEQEREYIESLGELHANPINLNAATLEDLLLIPILSREGAESILDYIAQHGSIKTIGELTLLPSIDYYTRQWLRLFVCVEELDKEKPKYPVKHELSTRLRFPFKTDEDYLSGVYQGRNISNNIKYKYARKNRFQIGFSAEKDAGESMHYNGGYDAYSAYLALHNLGRIDNLIIGDYKLHYGMGLTINSGFNVGKSCTLQRLGNGLTPHTGTDEFRFFRGFSSCISLGQNFRLTPFVSYRNLDVTLNEDGQIRTFLTNGYHRTKSELKRRQNLNSILIGVNLDYNYKNWNIGFTGYWNHFNHKFATNTEAYKHYNPKGDELAMMGIYYQKQMYQFTIQGETSYSAFPSGFATLNKIVWQPHNNWLLTASQRYYAKNHYSFYGQALSDNTSLQNESGGSLRLEAKPLSGMDIVLQGDIYYHPWVRYGVNHSSNGQELLCQFDLHLTRNSDLSFRYQLKHREEAFRGMRTHNRLNIKYKLKENNYWQTTAQIQLHTVGSKGYAVSIQQKFNDNRHWTLNGTTTWFHTDDYYSRVYSSDNNVSSHFFYPALYDHGFRLSALLRYKPSSHFTFETSWSGTYKKREMDSALTVQLRMML